MEKNLESAEALKKLKELVESINICMYCNMDMKSEVPSRPMGTVKVEDDGTIWFFTSDDTGAAAAAKQQGDVCLNYSNPTKNSYLCVTGTPELLHDKAKMEELWNPILKTWFPDGLETPGIALVKVTPHSANYWDSDAGRIRLMYSYLKAQITGEPDKGTSGDFGKLEVGNSSAASIH